MLPKYLVVHILVTAIDAGDEGKQERNGFVIYDGIDSWNVSLQDDPIYFPWMSNYLMEEIRSTMFRYLINGKVIEIKVAKRNDPTTTKTKYLKSYEI